MMVIGGCSLPVLILTHKPFLILSVVWLRRESERTALVGTWCPAKVNPPQVNADVLNYSLTA